MPTRRGRQSGFTLLEVILAMGMVSILAMSLYSGLRIAFRARDTATRALSPVRTMQIAMDLLRQDLESALPPTGLLAGPFYGEPLDENGARADTLEFYCVGEGPLRPEPTGWGGIRRINLGVTTLEDEKQTRVLVRRITSNLLSMVEPVPDEEIICRGIRSFTLRYYDGLAWQEMWDSTAMGDVLPMAVEVTLELEPPVNQNVTVEEVVPYRMTRIFTLACFREPELTEGGTEQ